MDAVYIDIETKHINLFNFKYREIFKTTSGQQIGSVSDSSKFLSFISPENTNDNENLDALDSITKEKLKCIRECLNSDDIWDITLFMISNESSPLSYDSPYLRQLQENLDINIQSITLNDIINFISKSPEKIAAQLLLRASSVMTYEESELSSSKSYIISVPVIELIRITCCDVKLREMYNLKDFSVLADKNLSQDVLFDNVRGYLGNTKFNNNIIKTLNEEPSKFFMYNNGITITAKNIISNPESAKTKIHMCLSEFQIVNGGQTLRSIYRQKEENFDEDKLMTAKILIRIFQTENNCDLTNNIAEYTNSQNAISDTDLKSVNNLQIKIENYFKNDDILYVRKVGDTGGVENETIFKYRISMERLVDR